MHNDVKKIIELIGGKENISSVTHCITRLRFILKDETKVTKEGLDEMELIKGISKASGQFQLIIGPGTVDRAYDELLKQCGLREDEEVQPVGNQSIVQSLINTFSGIFIPIIPALCAAGMLLGISNVIGNAGVFGEKSVVAMIPQIEGLYQFVFLVANTSFQFLPVLIGWSAVKKIGGNPVLGIVLGIILVHPDLMSSWDYVANPDMVSSWNIFGLKVNQVGYQGQIISIMCSAYILAKLELFFKKVIPDTVQMIFTPPLAMILTMLITFIVVGPATMYVSNLITNGFVSLYDLVPAFAAALLSFLFPLLLITGMHHLFLAVNLQMLGALGYVYLWPTYDTVTQAMGTAALTIFFITKNKKEKGVALSAGISAFLGITEPAIYGVNLPRKYPFIAVMIASAAGSAYLAIIGLKAVGLGQGGILSIISVYPEQWTQYIIGNLITIVLTVVLILFFDKTNMFSAENGKSNIFAEMRAKRVKAKQAS